MVPGQLLRFLLARVVEAEWCERCLKRLKAGKVPPKKRWHSSRQREDYARMGIDTPLIPSPQSPWRARDLSIEGILGQLFGVAWCLQISTIFCSRGQECCLSVSRIIRLSTAVYLLQYIIIICIQYQKEKDLARRDRHRFTSSISHVLQLYWGPQESQMTKFQKVFLYIFGERFEFTSIFQQKQALTTKVTSVPLHPCIILYLFF